MNYREPIDHHLKLDALQELEDVKLLIYRSAKRSLLTYSLFCLLILGFCIGKLFNQATLSTSLFWGICFVLLLSCYLLQLIFYKQTLFWTDKKHYLQRYINDFSLNRDQPYIPFNIHEMTHEALLSKHVVIHHLSDKRFLLLNLVLLGTVFYTAYQA